MLSTVLNEADVAVRAWNAYYADAFDVEFQHLIKLYGEDTDMSTNTILRMAQNRAYVLTYMQFEIDC